MVGTCTSDAKDNTTQRKERSGEMQKNSGKLCQANKCSKMEEIQWRVIVRNFKHYFEQELKCIGNTVCLKCIVK